jgi:hypothetical protein
MCQYREDHKQAEAREALRRQVVRPPGHRSSVPRGNQETDRRDVERGVEKLRRVLTH